MDELTCADIEQMLYEFETLESGTKGAWDLQSEHDALRDCTEKLVLCLARQIQQPTVEDLDELLVRFGKTIVLRLAGHRRPIELSRTWTPKTVVKPDEALGWKKPSGRPSKSGNEVVASGLLARIQVEVIRRDYPNHPIADIHKMAQRRLNIKNSELQERMTYVTEGLWHLVAEGKSTAELKAILANFR